MKLYLLLYVLSTQGTCVHFGIRSKAQIVFEITKKLLTSTNKCKYFAIVEDYLLL